MASNGAAVLDLGGYDWRPKTPNKWTVRVGNTSFDFPKQPLILFVLFSALLLLTYFKFSGSTMKTDPPILTRVSTIVELLFKEGTATCKSAATSISASLQTAREQSFSKWYHMILYYMRLHICWM